MPVPGGDHDGRLAVSIEEAAYMLGVSHQHVYPMVRDGELPGRRLGKRWVVSLEGLRKFMSETEEDQ